MSISSEHQTFKSPKSHPRRDTPKCPHFKQPGRAPIGNQDSVFSLAAPQTHVGRSRHTRNLEDLFICECESPVGKAEIGTKVNVIQCKKSDCETRWVSKFYEFSLSIDDLPICSSTIWNVSASREPWGVGCAQLAREKMFKSKSGVD